MKQHLVSARIYTRSFISKQVWGSSSVSRKIELFDSIFGGKQLPFFFIFI